MNAVPRVSNVYQRDWLRRSSHSKSFLPQLGDYVVYFPQGHLQHLLEFGDADLPFTTYSCCVCRVIGQSFAFPQHLCCSNSILLRLRLQAVAIPDPESQHSNSPIQSFVQPPHILRLPSFQVTLRDCGLPDYLVNLDTYSERMKHKWKVGDHFEMEFVEE